MVDNKHFQYVNKLPHFKEIYGKSKLWLKSLFLPPHGTLDLEYQDGNDELQNVITKITAMRDPGTLFISVAKIQYTHVTIVQTLTSVDKELYCHSIEIPNHIYYINMDCCTFISDFF